MDTQTHFPEMEPGAFSHEDDARQVRKLREVPGVSWAVRQLVRHSYEEAVRLRALGTSVRVGAGAYGHLHELLEEVVERLDIARPDCYVRRDPAPHASTTGLEQPTIILTTGLLDLLGEEEMLAALAHEVSHIHCRHLPYLLVSDFLRYLGAELGAGAAPFWGARVALEEWRQAALLSCDRGALLATGRLEVVQSWVCKLGGAGASENTYGAVSGEALSEQAAEYDDKRRESARGRLHRAMLLMDPTVCFMPERLAEISAWAESGAWNAFASGAYPRGDDAGSGDAASGEDEPPLWGAFAGSHAAGEEGEAPEIEVEELFRQGMDTVGAGLRTAAGGAVLMAQEGTEAMGRVVDWFLGSRGPVSGGSTSSGRRPRGTPPVTPID
jgi:Zn-dependent protease with chaperone function